MMRWHWGITLLVMGLASAGSAQPFNPHVFHVRASGGDCQSQRSLTGFRVEGRPGIVTALHGVVGCTVISATLSHGSGSEEHYGLLVTEVNIPLDIAVLTSTSLLSEPFDGLPVLSSNEAVEALDHHSRMSLIGYPIESSQVELFHISLTRPPLATIRDRIDTGIPALMVRRSPDVDAPLLSLEGSIFPGHSGAPLLLEGHVVGVALGGILGGGSLGWAARWIDVADRLVDVSDNEVASELARLARSHPVEAAFAIDRDPTLEVRLQTGESHFRDTPINVADLRNEYILDHSELDPRFVLNVLIEHRGSLVARGELGETMKAIDDRFAPLRFRVIKNGVFVLQVLRHVAVPAVEGSTLEHVREELERLGLSVGSVLSDANADVPAGAVIGTVPERGTEVSFGSPVDIRVSTGPATVPVPPLDGMTNADEAQAALENLGLVMRPVWTFSDAPVGYVLDSEPPGTTEVEIGSDVEVRVSRGWANVGIMASLSGRMANMGLLLFTEVETAILSVAAQLSVCDTATTEEGATQCARRFVDEGVDLVLLETIGRTETAIRILDGSGVQHLALAWDQASAVDIREQLESALRAVPYPD